MSLNKKEEIIDDLCDAFLRQYPDWMVFAVQHDPALHRYINKDVPISEIDLEDLFQEPLYDELQHYPGLKAIAAHKKAHELFQVEDTRAQARELSEAVKSLTGIEIHPEADVDPYTFIDHGNGVVVGADAHMGRGVQLFKGVTLGSFGKTPEGERRHPTIGNNVIISDSAQLLGRCDIGDDVKIGPASQIINAKIGVGSIIGPAVHWQNQDIPDHTRVTAKGDLVVLSPIKASEDEKSATKWYARPVVEGLEKVQRLYDAALKENAQSRVA